MNSLGVSTMHSLKPFQCPNCKTTYSSKESSRFHVTRFPRILTCCHSVCENCLHVAEKKKSFSCPTCQAKVDLSDEDPVSKLLPDVHALGILSANTKNSIPSIKVKMVPSSERRNQDTRNKFGLSIICGHCKTNSASWRCDECELNFCSICFKENHNDTSKKKKHEGKKIFAELYNSMVQEGCPEHENKTVEFYCEVDNILTCSFCMLIGDHVNHEVKTLVDKNKSCAEDLKTALEGIPAVQKQLKYADHLICEELPKEKVDISGTIKSVHDYFHKLHAALQIRETELISELTEISQRNVKALEEMRLQVTHYENDLTSLRKDAESVIENPCLAVSAPAILRKLEESKNIPCYLVPILNGPENDFSMSVSLNSEFEEKLKEIGEVHFNIKTRFTLLSKNELPEGYTTDIPESFSNKIQVILDAESHSASNDTFSEDSLLTNNSHNSTFSSMQASLKCREFTKMQPEKVLVSHIKDPSCFYVQRYSEIRKLKAISEAIDKWCRSFESKKTKVSSVETGDLYLVKYSVDNRWYRARVKSLHISESEEKGIKQSPKKNTDAGVHSPEKDMRVVVFYIDFGNTEVTPISNIKQIQLRFLNLPGVAKECSLADIIPANSEEWSKEAITTFSKFVSNKTLVMNTFEERNNVFLVDLSQVADNDICNDVPVSVRDSLVFLELAVFPGGFVKSSNKRIKNERNYMPPESLRINAKICAIVSHVEQPSHFYVQQISTASYLANLIHEMNETYNNEKISLRHEIYAPRVGMACAAQFSVDDQWYRAKVLGLPGGGMVEVQYIDFGNKEVINYKHLRKLYNKFFKLNIQAIPCKLADVTYNQAKAWSAEARNWLTNEVSKKQLTLYSLGTIPGENKAEVVLYYTNEDYDVCVNALMVEQKLASSTGRFSTTVKTKREIPKEISVPIKPIEETAFIPPPLPKHNTPPLPKHNTPPLPKLNENHRETLSSEVISVHRKTEPVPFVTPSLVSSPRKKKYPSLATPSTNGTDYIDVHVCHIESPGLFYIRIAGDNENKLQTLMIDLQNEYKNLEGDLVDCSVGKAYAVFSTIQKKWFRGAVVEKLSDDKLKVHHVDYGNTEEVEKKFVRKLVEKFTIDEAFSIRCHLDGITPPGGSSQWPHTACDAFKRIVEPHDVLLLSSKGESDLERKSLPSDLLIEKLIVGGALEPTKIEHLSISAEITKQGLGLPVRRSKTNSPSLPSPQEVPEVKQEPSSSSKDIPDKICNECISVEPSEPIVPEEPIPPSLPNFQWKPVVPPFEPNFNGQVTNIGEDGSIHLYVLHEGTSQVDTISKALLFKYGKEDFKPLKTPPPIGEACIAKFSVDNQWYRAEVLSVYPGKIKVNFVDYGNNEIVPLSFIRTDIIMKSFPRQCLECSLYGINPSKGKNGKFDSGLLTFLHSQLVDNRVSVEIQGTRDEAGRIPCVIKTASGIDVADLLMSMGFDENLEDSCEEMEQVSATFASAQELREGSIFPVCVTQVNSEKIVYLQLLELPEPKDDYEKQLNETHNSFLKLIQELRKNANAFPKLHNPMPGMPCCAKYSYDNNWYRCEITDLTEDGVVGLYVDYGNSEKISRDDLRELKNYFINFPVQIHFCELYGIKPFGAKWDPQVREHLVNKLLVSNQELFAQVVVPGKISQVDLLVRTENGKYELAYQELIEKNLIKLESHMKH